MACPVVQVTRVASPLPPPPAASAANVLRAWKAKFTNVSPDVQMLIDEWDTGLPCDNAWWGVTCGDVNGETRVTELNFDLSSIGPDATLTTRIIPALRKLPLETM